MSKTKTKKTLQHVGGAAAREKLGVEHYSKISKKRWLTFYRERATQLGITVRQYKSLTKAEIKIALAKVA